MADKSIDQLIAAEQILPTDLFVLQQSNVAKKLPGQILLNWLTAAADGHGGVRSIEKIGTNGLVDTYRITLADTTTFDFVVTNGRGVNTIVKVGTSDLVDTYQINYNDGTTGTFNVTNGAKGDKGDNTYIWIKYASQRPTASSHSFGDIVDDWIGIYYGTSATAPTDWQQYEWFQIKGEKGDTGAPATLLSAFVEYQIGDSGTIIPSGNWSTSIPVVAQGKYLWTRTTNTFNTGDPVISYSVSRMGMDGAGSVSSVAGVSPDLNGNVALTAENIGALSNTGGDLTGELKMNGQPISGLNVPVTNDQAANMGFVNHQMRKAAPRNLLDDSYFADPVNQRGKSTYTGTAGYCIDRWRRTSGLDVTIDSGKITLQNVKTNDFYSLLQKIEPGKITAGSTYTLALKTADGTVYIGVVSAPHEPNSSSAGTGVGDIQIGTAAFFRLELTNDGLYQFRICVHISNTLELVWAALYEGEYTAETLPEYQPKGYGAELLECQRYYVTLGTVSGMGYTYSTTTAYVNFILPVVMRVKPSVIASDDLEFTIRSGNKKATISGIGDNNYIAGNNHRLSLSVSGKGLTADDCLSVMKTAGTLEFNAELDKEA